MIKSLGPGLDSLDFLRIALGNQHLFIVIQNSNLSKPLVLTWPQLLQQIQAQLNITSGSTIDVRDEGSVIDATAQFLNFIGAGVTVTQNGTGVDIDIPGGGGAVDSVNGQTGIVVLALDDISDVSASSPNTGDYLKWNQGTLSWINAPIGVNNGLNIDISGDIHLGGNLIKPNTIINTGTASYTLRFDATGGVNTFGAYAFTAVAGSTNLPNQVLASFKADDCTVALFTGQSFNGTGGTAVKIVSQHSSITPLDVIGTFGDILKALDTGQLILGQYTTSTSFGSGLTSVGLLNVDNTGKVFVSPVPTGTGTVSSVGTGTGLTGGPITTTGTISLNSKLAPADSLAGNSLKYLRVNAGETAVEYATASSSGGILHGTASGTDTYTVTITGATTYADGDAYLIRFTNGNTTSATLNINAFGAVPLYRNNDGQLIGGDIVTGGEMLCVYNSTTNRFQVIGTAPNTLLSYVTNDDTVTLTKGMAVFAFGGTGDRMTVKRASNLGDSTSAQTVGLVLSTSIAANQKGLIMMQGLLDGLNILPTATWSDGDPVYLGDTPGSITPIKPHAPKHLVYLGVVTTANNGSAGRMYVKVQNGYELDELHNVQAQSPANNDTLYYDIGATPIPQWKTTSVNTLLNTSIKTGSCGVVFDGQGGVISNGRTAYVQVPYNGTITGWTLVAAQSGSCTVTVFKDTFLNFPPISPGDNIFGTQPALVGVQTNSATGLSVSVAAGDWIGFTISGVTTVTWVNLSISITKT